MTLKSVIIISRLVKGRNKFDLSEYRLQWMKKKRIRRSTSTRARKVAAAATAAS